MTVKKLNCFMIFGVLLPSLAWYFYLGCIISGFCGSGFEARPDEHLVMIVLLSVWSIIGITIFISNFCKIKFQYVGDPEDISGDGYTITGNTIQSNTTVSYSTEQWTAILKNIFLTR